MQVRFRQAASASPSRRLVLNKAMRPAPFRGLNLCLMLLWVLGLLTAPTPAAFAQATLGPSSPANVHATGGTHQVTLSWDAVPVPPASSGMTNSISYNVYKATASGGETALAQGIGSTTSKYQIGPIYYKDTSVTNGTTYFYYITTVLTSREDPVGINPQPQALPMRGAQKLRAHPHTMISVTEGPPSAEVNAIPLVRLDCGGADYTDGTGRVWNADQDFTGGTAITTTAAITGTNDPMLFQAQRSGAQVSYAELVVNGTYTLSLLFAEIEGKTTGQRVFNVTANGTQVLTGYDISQDAGGANKAVVKTFPVTVTNGQFSLSLAGVTGNAALAAFSLLPIKPTADIPPPGWAMDVIPTDSGSEVGGAGPGSSMQISLPSGVEENTPGPDLSAYNPVGPSVSYERTYRSTLSAQGYGSPGLSPGWVDNYDLRITSGSGAYTLNYPNGAAETWTGTTGSLGTPPGAPYLATAPSAGVLTMTFRDRSSYTFTQIATASVNYPVGAYLLSSIKNLVGHSVTLNRDTANNNYRILSITNDAVSPVTLLQFNYNGVNLLSVQDLASQTLQAANEHREVGY